MSNSSAERLLTHSSRIMKLWADRASQELAAAKNQEELALYESMPDYLEHLADALSKKIDRTEARRIFDFNEAIRIGKKHGNERARSLNYTIDQLITEYHILRQVICDVLEEDAPLTPAEREIIVCSVEQAVNDAATQFSDTLRDIQEKLTHTLAHDLRNPISAAKTSAQLILRRPDNVEQALRSANRICGSMDRLDSMIHDLLDASRIRAGESVPLEFVECDLDLIARQVAEEFNFLHNDRFIVVSISECRGLWSESGIRRVLENLCTNAVKYGEAMTPVTITVRQTPRGAVLSVHNQGKPIPHEDQGILFEQARRARSTKAKMGWGLGLTVVKGITEAHHGTVQVRSEEGLGTTFRIELP